MGLTPPVLWALTPRDTDLLVRGWNEEQGGGDGVAPPSPDDVAELRLRYPDG